RPDRCPDLSACARYHGRDQPAFLAVRRRSRHDPGGAGSAGRSAGRIDRIASTTQASSPGVSGTIAGFVMTPIGKSGIAPALQIHGLCRQFGALAAAQSIDFVLPQGGRHALIGPNGAGKTTFLNLITGMLRPDAGSIHLLGEDITALRPDQRVRRGLVRTFQRANLFPALTPLESVTMAICERTGSTANWRRRTNSYSAAMEEAFSLLQQLRLSHLADRPAATLAYGQQRILEV